MKLPTDKSFVELVGFTHIEAWRKFKEEYPEEAKMITDHFNTSLRTAVQNSKEILSARNLEPDYYNQTSKKHLLESAEQTATKLLKITEEWPDKPPSSQEVPNQDSTSHPECKRILQQNQNLITMMKKITNEKIELEKMFGLYKQQFFDSSKKTYILQNRLQDINQRLFETISSISEITDLRKISMNKFI